MSKKPKKTNDSPLEGTSTKSGFADNDESLMRLRILEIQAERLANANDEKPISSESIDSQPSTSKLKNDDKNLDSVCMEDDDALTQMCSAQLLKHTTDTLSKEFEEFMDLLDHFEPQEKLEKKLLKCEDCMPNRYFNTQKSFKIHMDVVHGIRNLVNDVLKRFEDKCIENLKD